VPCSSLCPNFMVEFARVHREREGDEVACRSISLCHNCC
jgi:hypothetical protein